MKARLWTVGAVAADYLTAQDALVAQRVRRPQAVASIRATLVTILATPTRDGLLEGRAVDALDADDWTDLVRRWRAAGYAPGYVPGARPPPPP